LLSISKDENMGQTRRGHVNSLREAAVAP